LILNCSHLTKLTVKGGQLIMEKGATAASSMEAAMGGCGREHQQAGAGGRVVGNSLEEYGGI
jgi:hypothetical protein